MYFILFLLNMLFIFNNFLIFSLISNFLKRENPEVTDTVAPPKKKRKLTQGRSRKRRRSKIQRDNSGPKVKKPRKVKIDSPKSPEVDVVDENTNLQPVS